MFAPDLAIADRVFGSQTKPETIVYERLAVARETAWLLDESCGAFHRIGDRADDCPGCREHLTPTRRPRRGPEIGSPEYRSQVREIVERIRDAGWHEAGRRSKNRATLEAHNLVLGTLDRLLIVSLADEKTSRHAVAEARRRILEANRKRKANWSIV